ncbi:hemerythrin domain-containing protein [Pararhodonellum marinum]|uniref:hemerythrin domain-containing protein n=1 Tax=Pararhodonellum marinum TaxID=2755358 RepID=UPI00188EBFF7|nr:hemerythrin domain-containing protein [Pararhodonellum marinum]
MQKPQRINPYLLPHKGLRHLLAKTSLLAGNLDVSKQSDIEQLHFLSLELFFLLEQHARTEDHMILPLLEQKAPGSTIENMEEHERLEAMVHQLATQLDQLRFKAEPQLFIDYFLELSDFHSQYLAHMIMEERAVLDLIWTHFSDQELMDLHHRILASFSPEKILRWFRYIVPALNPSERFMVLSGLRDKAPKPFFDALIEVIKPELDEAVFSELLHQLTGVEA